MAPKKSVLKAMAQVISAQASLIDALQTTDNGEVAEVLPKRIKFLDGKEMFEECCFFEENQGEREEE